MEKQSVGSNRWHSEKSLEIQKNDYQINFNAEYHKYNVRNFNDKNSVDIFFDGLQNCFNEYVQKFSILQCSKLRGSYMKMQRVPPGGGYHVWHYESDGDRSARVIVYTLYLNSLQIEQAGETEFLYLQQRFRPIENQMLLWPAGYTHTHRGNTVFGEKSKYIVTGWFYHD